VPTKPSTVFTFATTTNYTVGARIGQPTKYAPIGTEGFIPGANAAPEQINYCFNVTGEWLSDWILLGTFNPDLDAHILETDGSGHTAIARAVLGGTADTVAGLEVNANAGFTTHSALFSNTVGGVAIQAASDAAQPAVRGVCTGSGAGVEGSATGGTGPGVRGVGVPANGVEGTCTVAGSFGVEGTSAPAAANSFGVVGTATQSAGGGVFGRNLNAGADPTNPLHAGMFGIATEGTGVWGQSTDGHGVVAATTGTNRAPFRIEPVAAKPTFVTAGDYWFNNTINRLFGVANSSPGGVIYHASEKGHAGGTSTTGSGTRAVLGESGAIATLTVAQDEMPTTALDTVVLNLTGSFRNLDATVHYVDLRIYDTTAGGPAILDQTIYLQVPNATLTNSGGSPNAFEQMPSIRLNYPVPLAGARTFEVRIQIDTNVGLGIGFEQVILTLDGAY